MRLYERTLVDPNLLSSKQFYDNSVKSRQETNIRKAKKADVTNTLCRTQMNEC